VLDDVHAIYAKLFSSLGVDSATLARLRAERRSVLDFVGQDLERFRGRLGTEGRQKVELHLQSIRNIESRLDQIGTASTPPAPGAGINSYSKDQYDQIAKVQIDMVVGALATGQTSIASMLWSNGHNNGWVFEWLGGDYGQPGDGSFNPHDRAVQGGQGRGRYAPGQHRRPPRQQHDERCVARHHRVLVSIANAMGDPITSFGPAQYGGALPQLT
jgi:hypothetical protein